MDTQISEDPVSDLGWQATPHVAWGRRKPHSNRFKALRAGLRLFTKEAQPQRAVDYEIKEHTGIRVRNPVTGDYFRYPEDFDVENQRGRPVLITQRQLLMRKVCPRYFYKRAKALTGWRKNK